MKGNNICKLHSVIWSTTVAGKTVAILLLDLFCFSLKLTGNSEVYTYK
jgi:hypothetical protein